MMTRKANSIAEKSMAFAVRVVRLCRYLSMDKRENVIVMPMSFYILHFTFYICRW